MIIVYHLCSSLVLDEGDTLGISESFGAPGKRFGIDVSKAKTKSFLSLHYYGDDGYLLVNAKKLIEIVKMLIFLIR